jgi:CheY-like chemotaxis protein
MTSVLAAAQPLLLMSSERAVRVLLGHLLRQEGYTCTAASDGDAAFEEIGKSRPLAAVLDMRAPEDDDLLFLGLLRKRHPWLGAIILLPGRCLVVHGRTEHVIENNGDGPTPNLPSVAQLREAIDWIATQTLLDTWKPPQGLA